MWYESVILVCHCKNPGPCFAHKSVVARAEARGVVQEVGCFFATKAGTVVGSPRHVVQQRRSLRVQSQLQAWELPSPPLDPHVDHVGNWETLGVRPHTAAD